MTLPAGSSGWSYWLAALARIPPALTAIVGALLGGLAAGSFMLLSGASPAAPISALYGCPNAGVPIGEAADGDRLLVTGRSADGEWYEVYHGAPGLERLWSPAEAFELEGDPSDLPTAGCRIGRSPAEVALATLSPTISARVTETPLFSASPFTSAVTVTPTPTAALRTPTPRPPTVPPRTATPTPSTPPAAPSPTPSPSPDTMPPDMGELDSDSDVFYHPGSSGCDTDVQISVVATDASGIESVVLHYLLPNENLFRTQAMTSVGTTSTYAATLVAQVSWPDPVTSPGAAYDIAYYVSATDGAGNSGRLPGLEAVVELHYCLI